MAERPGVSDRRHFAILMNPASAGGKAQRLLPEVRAVLGAAGAETRVVETRDMPHAAEAAREPRPSAARPSSRWAATAWWARSRRR